jgi:hypothetical protein
MKPSVLAGLAAGVAIPVYGVYLRYRRDMSAARARLVAVDRHLISTRWGAVEYADRGSGAPVLVVHGIYHHCVGGLLSVRDLFLDRVIAPSRFGYLGSSMPPNATPSAQADGSLSARRHQDWPDRRHRHSQPVQPRRCNSPCGARR